MLYDIAVNLQLLLKSQLSYNEIKLTVSLDYFVAFYHNDVEYIVKDF